MSIKYHVSKMGSDFNEGSLKEPFLTIQKAAELAVSGDFIIVHEGVYREWVKPRYSGRSNDERITYMAADGEKVIIKGSEVIKGWEEVAENVWKVSIDNRIFGEYNPYNTEIEGDWMVAPREKKVHTGDVYLNGKSFFEADSLDAVINPVKWTKSIYETWGNCEEKLINPEESIYRWYAEVDREFTIIYANFHGKNPNTEEVEINVRKACFFPENTGVNYITVKGFEIAEAATTWAPPTALQYGILGVHWSKGWIIEENIIHDSKCSGISLGKEGTTGENDFRKGMRKPGYQYQMESVFKAIAIGWSKENVGSHIIRKNKIYDCGQNGIVGHMGSAFSEICDNEIYRIGIKHEFYGHELGGIKFHGAIDSYIHNNYIHHCTLGTWLDWQVQGIRVSSNIYAFNNRDFFIEVTHGPYIVDNNIFTAEYTMDNAAQGGAFINNIIGGFINHYPVLNRPTPYHFPHSTKVLGVVPTYGGDDRWFYNIFVGGDKEGRRYGTEEYNGSTTSISEYSSEVKKKGFGYIEHFEMTLQPAYINKNIYLNGAEAFENEKNNYMDKTNPNLRITSDDEYTYLEMVIPEGALKDSLEITSSKDLGSTRITEARYENPDGSDVFITNEILKLLKPGMNKIRIWRQV